MERRTKRKKRRMGQWTDGQMINNRETGPSEDGAERTGRCQRCFKAPGLKSCWPFRVKESKGQRGHPACNQARGAPRGGGERRRHDYILEGIGKALDGA